MSELRQDPFTNEWVIFASERSKRPDEFKSKNRHRDKEYFVSTCPFCPGNEAQTPPELYRLDNPGGKGWDIRVVSNKFAALSRTKEPIRTVSGLHHSIAGGGVHDVIIESRDHSSTTALYADQQVANILRVYKTCLGVISSDPRIGHVTIFKNHGEGAGTSLQHPHSQIIGTPVVSSYVRGRMYEAMRHYDQYGECVFCAVIDQEQREKSRVLMQTEHFVALAPYASAVPFLTHIYPRRHMASYGQIHEDELDDLAHILKDTLARLYFGLGDPDWNYTIRTAPSTDVEAASYHWYLSIIPRLSNPAGFELGSGMFINTVMPETAAEFLRGIDIAKVSADNRPAADANSEPISPDKETFAHR